MSSVTSENLLKLSRPLLIISSQAGLGNARVGQTLQKSLSADGTCEHISIESLISGDLARANFERHRWICDRAPWLLYFIYGTPLNYALKSLKETILPNRWPAAAVKKLSSYESIVATNHRALFWLSSLKRRGFLKASLHGVMGDYEIGWGWKSVFADFVDGFYGPLPLASAPESWRGKYQQIPVPVDEVYKRLASRPGSQQEVLISGGGWGLGPIEDICADLLGGAPQLKLHVAGGDNQPLLKRLKNRWPNESRLHLYGTQESLGDVMSSCGMVICKPGGVTIAEAATAKRQLFLVPGLPVIEAGNARFARENFGAHSYSIKNVLSWLQAPAL